MLQYTSRRPLGPCVAVLFWLTLGAAALAQAQRPQQAQPSAPAPRAQPPQQFQQPSIIHKIVAANERMEMTVDTSRILTLDQKIPQAQVNNPDILELHPLSPTQVQVFARKPGVTQVNLWGEDQKIYTIDTIVYGDAQTLTLLLRSQFPNSSIKVIPVANGVLISGYVDQPEDVSRIIQIAEEFYPKVLNNLSVGGVQQVLLHVKVMEVSRTKLRTLGFDFAKITNGNVVFSGISGLISAATSSGIAASASETFAFSVVDGRSAFFGVLEALRQDNLMKVLAEPTLVTVSGRPAFFQVGGEFPILVPQSLGTTSIEFKKFGTQVDFVPIVLGNGRIRLEVRPRVSEIDSTRSVTINSYTVPGLRVREVDTGVEMTAGQTLAIAGLVQNRVEAANRGLPWVSEVPYLGALFRRVREENNEIELLILVTPELVDAMHAREVPQCGPGLRTTSPDDWDLYLKGHLEVPNCCPTCNGAGCAACFGSRSGMDAPAGPGRGQVLEEGTISNSPESIEAPRPDGAGSEPPRPPLPPGSAVLPAGGGASQPEGTHAASAPASAAAAATQGRPLNPPSRYASSKPQIAPPVSRSAQPNAEPGFIGPVGYDVK